MVAPSDIHIMMNGLPGAMGQEVAAACLRRGFKIAPYAFTGPDVELDSVNVNDQQGGAPITVSLIKGPTNTENEIICEGIIAGLKVGCKHLICIDYTHPSSVNCNGAFYARNQLNFVMGTTGGDRETLLKNAKEGGAYAIIAPNMAKQIVALQAGLADMANTYPGAFAGYTLTITESHQTKKADTSGTAKAIAQSLATLNNKPYNIDQINMIRDPASQLAFGVPEQFIGGHAYHTYSLKSSDNTVEFQFVHNVNGRRIYAEGTADAVEFLAKQIAAKSEQKVYSMIDVLKMGGI